MKNTVSIYDLIPVDGTQTLYSYNTPIVSRDPAGALTRLWPFWSATTGRHVKAFCGLNKAGYEALPFVG